MPLLAALSRIFSRAPAAPPPPSPAERQRLAHRRRAAERELRSLERTLKRVGCSTCVNQAPDRGAIQMERQASALRGEIRAIDERLAEAA